MALGDSRLRAPGPRRPLGDPERGLYLARQSLLVTWLLEDFNRMLAGDGRSLPGGARQELQSWLAA